ncbi:MAG: hypothetical protein LBN21_04850 [Treponema sp.]|jgi:hypothetical protein|nr:hypothetical protein [Treponema sp.]
MRKGGQKKMIKGISRVILFFAILFVSCKINMDDKNDLNDSEEVEVSILAYSPYDSGSRTLVPTVPECLYYELTIVSDSNEAQIIEFENLENMKVKMKKGIWAFALKGIIDDGIVLYEGALKDIIVSNSTQIYIHLECTDGMGYLEMKINVIPRETTDFILYRISKIGREDPLFEYIVNYPDYLDKTIITELEEGIYDRVCSLYDKDGNVVLTNIEDGSKAYISTFNESVHIYPNLITKSILSQIWVDIPELIFPSLDITSDKFYYESDRVTPSYDQIILVTANVINSNNYIDFTITPYVGNLKLQNIVIGTNGTSVEGNVLTITADLLGMNATYTHINIQAKIGVLVKNISIYKVIE